MVNAAKRMRALTEKLFKIRYGPGAVTIPPPREMPAQLTSIFMRVPTGKFPYQKFFVGGRRFWRGPLRRLKYWNPALKTEVKTIAEGEHEPMYLTVEYTSTDRGALEKLKTTPLPTAPPSIKLTKESKESGDYQSKAAQLGVPESVFDQGNQAKVDAKFLPSIRLTPEVLAHAPKDEITVKAQPAADASAPQTSSPPQTLYSRTVTLPIAGLGRVEIWNWIRQLTGLPEQRPVPASDMQEYEKLCVFKKAASEDRTRVYAGIGAMKKEEAELKQARAAAERMAAESL